MATAKTIYLAVWDHKHGQDVSAHTTENGAFNQCVQWARCTVEEWEARSWQKVGGIAELSDEELFNSWGDITGDTEFFRVEPTQLHGA
jgi:hypothetical protein